MNAKPETKFIAPPDMKYTTPNSAPPSLPMEVTSVNRLRAYFAIFANNVKMKQTTDINQIVCGYASTVWQSVIKKFTKTENATKNC